MSQAIAPSAARFGLKPRREPVPTVLQQENTECGAACLGMILAHYGRYVPLEELRMRCGVSRDGAKPSRIFAAATSFGLIPTASRTQMTGLNQTPLPAILFWGFNHFVVLEGFAKDGAWINDPASGRQLVTWEEFSEKFTGVVLEFRPGPEFTPGGVKSRLISGLRTRLRQVSPLGPLSLAVIAGLALTVPALIIPALLAIIVNDLASDGMASAYLPVVVGLLLAGIAQFALTNSQQEILRRLSAKLSISMSIAFVDHVLRLPRLFFVSRYSGSILSRLQQADALARLLSSELSLALLALVQVVAYLLMLAWIDLPMAVVTAVFGAAILATLIAAGRQQREKSSGLASSIARLSAVTYAGILSIESLKACGAESVLARRIGAQHARVVSQDHSLNRSGVLLAALPTLITGIFVAILLSGGAWQVSQGTISAGGFTAVFFLSMSALTPVNILAGLSRQVQEAEGQVTSLDDVMDYPESLPPTGEATGLTELSGQLTCAGLSFAHSPMDPPFINDFTLTVAPGQRVALVGPSGSGKTTIARMIAGITEPDSGTITFDGVPRSQIAPSVLTSGIAYVAQEMSVFGASIRDNLTLWDTTIAEKSLLDACQDARIWEDIAVRQGALDSEVAESGTNLSGGQVQRLEIARALAATPRILILDEATSALDPQVEQEVDEAIKQRGCTVIMVAHRLSTVRDADEILVLEAGSITARGTHETLLNTCALYRELVSDG